MLKLYKTIGYILFFISILYLSCTRHLVNSGFDYLPFNENLKIQQVEIIDSAFMQILANIEDSAKVFEKEVNADQQYDINYYITVGSFCKNDSSFIVLTVRGGSYFFYGFENELDRRVLDQYMIVKGTTSQVLMFGNFTDKLCLSSKSNFYSRSPKAGEFKLEWYKYKNDEWLLDSHPSFYEIYLIDDGEFRYIERVFPDRVTEIR